MRIKPHSNRAKRLRGKIGRRALLAGATYKHVDKKFRGYLLPQQLRTIGANERMARLLKAGGPWADQLKPLLTAVYSVQRVLHENSARSCYQKLKKGK